MWKFIDDYFRSEFKTYLAKEFKRNRHLQLNNENPTQTPPVEAKPDFIELSPDDVKPFISGYKEKQKTCNQWHFREELDYYNQKTTNDRKREDDDGFVSYWLRERSKDNSDYNLHCQANCEDNTT